MNSTLQKCDYTFPAGEQTKKENSTIISDERALCEKVYEHISNICSEDVVTLIGARLHEIVSTFSPSTVDKNFVAKLLKGNFKTELFVSKEDQTVLFAVEVVLKAAAIYFLSLLPENMFEIFNTTDELLKEYPMLCKEPISSDPAEMEYLLTYRNMMAVALTVIPAKCNKKLLLTVCAMLEGSGRHYATGGTQSRATSIRVWIYEQESQCWPRKRSSIRIARKKDSPERIVCSCGSNILKRTNWKHQKSIKHNTLLAYRSSKSEL